MIYYAILYDVLFHLADRGIAVGKCLRIALLIESSRGYGRDLLSGIAAYARVVGPWTFYHHEERSISDTLPKKLRDWSPDGVIARVENPKLARQLADLRVPIVDLLEKRLLPTATTVLSDHKAIAQMAAKHLESLGLRNFAFCGFPGIAFSEARCKHFCDYVGKRGHTAYVFQPRRRPRTPSLTAVEAQTQRQTAEFATWLRNLPKPVGILACNDLRAHYLLNSREEIGVQVPDEVMVIGVDNDPILCELSGLPLSSIDPNAEQVGNKAAALLHKMIQGRKTVARTTQIAPRGVVVRQSTNALAIPHQEMADILRYLRDHACDGLTVKSLLQQKAISRGTLCRWFSEHLGRTPAEEIKRVQIERVKELLSTNMTLEEISRHCGFTCAETMYRLFKRITGQTPGEFRHVQ